MRIVTTMAAATTVHRRWLIPLALAPVAGLVGWWAMPDDSTAPAPVAPGAETYAYATSGFEEVDALGGARHAYPTTTRITVRPTRCGRQLVWRPLRDRSTAYELCGGRLRSIEEVHKFFGRGERTSYRCAASSALRVGWRCRFGDTMEVASGDVVGVERIGGTDAVHVRLETRLSGGVEGTGTRDFWLRRADGFPVRLAATNVSSTASVIGRVHYRERYRLDLRNAAAGDAQR